MPARRAGQQLLESSAIVVALLLILEWIAPWLSGRATDGAQLAFACVFGALVVILHTLVAYLRPPNKAELTAQIEEILHEEERLRTSPGMPRVRQFAQWATNDPTWETTVETPSVRLPPRQ